MSEYTPTTKEIIEHWSAVKGQAIDPEARDRHLERAAMFRRWLAAHDAEVRQEQADHDAVRINDLDTRLVAAERSLASVVAEGPEWESDSIQYGHLVEGGIFIIEHKGKNYSAHQRRIKLGKPESSWVPAPKEGTDDE